MDSTVYWCVAVGSLASMVTAALVLWHRARIQAHGDSGWRRVIVFVMGTAALGSAFAAFSVALATFRPLQAATIVILITSWAAVIQPVLRLPVPQVLQKIGRGESRLLRWPVLGVRRFGRILRGTPLRHLGGRVYMAGAGGDLRAVLRGIHDAESVHVWALLVSVPCFAIWSFQGNWRGVLSGLLVHLPLNIYPVLHLRYVRSRLDRHLELACSRRKAPVADSQPCPSARLPQ